MIRPSFAEFKRLSKKGNLIPVSKEILADLETPVSAFKKIERKSEYAYLLESVEGGEKLARYSFLGKEPSLIFRSKGELVEIEEGKKKRRIKGNPLLILKKILNEYKPIKDTRLPRFCGGFVGYLGYDMIRFIEKIPDYKPDDLNLPDSFFILTDTLLVFDHLKGKIKIISHAHLKHKNLFSSYQRAVKKIEEIEELLKKPLSLGRVPRDPFGTSSATTSKEGKIKFRSNFSKKSFRKAVLDTKQYIREGEVIQVVLSQRWKRKFCGDSFDLYRALRSINPSPYLFYLKLRDLKIVGSSPEILVRLEEGEATLRPIAGTRPRGRDEKEDRKLEEELLSDEKERAEHIMLVDLGRNDLGRVCEYKSIRTTDLMTTEKYSHVIHIVSNITGQLKRGKDSFDLFSASFPAGTVTGAPKIRAMEIIEELEPVHRGIYAGAIGYFSFSGNLDTCIAIRTLILKNESLYIQAGAGIVADSIPEREYDETLNKGKALLEAVRMAEEGL